MKINLFTSLIMSICASGSIVLAQVPDIVKVDKTSGTFGEYITISGSGFSPTKTNLSVHFGAAKGTIINSTEYSIEVLAPAGAIYSPISVTNLVSKSTGYSKNNFNLAFNGKTFEESRIKQSLKIPEDKELFDLCNCDFNGDGLNDVVATNNTDDVGSTSITAYQNITQTSEYEIKFQKINDPNLNTGKGARNIVCGDLDGDGKPELVVGKGGGNADRIYIFKNVSTTSIKFNTPITVLLSENVTNSTTRRLRIHDIDKDGKPDIIMSDQGKGNIYIFQNKSTASAIDFPSSARQVLPSGAGSLVGLDVADINGDNKPEIVCNSDKSDVFIFQNKSVPGTITMAAPQKISISGATLVNMKIGDLDNDGDKDIVVTNLVNNIFILVNSGNATSYSFSSTKLIETGRAPWGLDLGDINGDGLTDIIVATTDAAEKLTMLINTSSGTTLSYATYYVGNTDISFNTSISDFSGDAKPDIAYLDRKANEIIFLRNLHCVISDILPKNPPAICSNKPVTLLNTPALKVNYAWKNTTTNQDIVGGIKADITIPGTHISTITSTADGCASTSTGVAVVAGTDNLPPAVTVTNPGTVCAGSTFNLTAQLVAGVTYYWVTPRKELKQGNVLTVTNSSIDDAGRYSLVLESAGCRTEPTFQLVDISTIPPMEVSASAGSLFCDGTTNTLAVPLIPMGQYTWKFNSATISGANANTYTASQSGTYSATVKNAYNCTATSNNLVIKKVIQPVASFADVTSSCLNQEVLFNNTSTYDNTETPVFAWDFGDGTSSTEKNPKKTFSKAGDFKVILSVGYNNTTCSDTYEYLIKVAEFQDLVIKADGEDVADGQFNLCDGNKAILSVTAKTGTVTWNTGATTPSISISDAGTYTVTSGANTGCSSMDEILVSKVENVALEVTSGSQRIEGGSTAQLGAAGADFYTWTPPTDLDNPNIANPLASPKETTEYLVTGSNNFGCLDSAKVIVYVDEKVTIPVSAPQTFSPNGDGRNDLWIINNIDVFESCPIKIFNRRGQSVYEKSQYNNDWDGLHQGVELPEGAYYYIITCGANEVHTGNVALIR
ncbi:MAG: FG-GAP-like repeat-containing protein [Cyclobacteriaceae bacterium]|nr:FG-GAP-like repeat-containing protein [Cyclobacteriaceae bacterium]